MRKFSMEKTRWTATALVLSLASLAGGCATVERPWGADAALKPGWQRLGQAARNAAISPGVWVPLAGAAAFQIDHWDRKVSNWARRETPIFGSQQSASDWSDRLRTASAGAYFATVVLAPGAEEPGEWVRDKAQGLLVGLGAIGATGLATSELKNATGRNRPNGEGNQSFPSGHASHSAVSTGLAHDNLLSFDLSNGSRRTLDLGLDALTVGTAWARVEAGAHFPADTLAGIALGHFVSRFFDEAFLKPATSQRLTWMVAPTRGGVTLRWTWRWDPGSTDAVGSRY